MHKTSWNDVLNDLYYDFHMYVSRPLVIHCIYPIGVTSGQIEIDGIRDKLHAYTTLEVILWRAGPCICYT